MNLWHQKFLSHWHFAGSVNRLYSLKTILFVRYIARNHFIQYFLWEALFVLIKNNTFYKIYFLYSLETILFARYIICTCYKRLFLWDTLFVLIIKNSLWDIIFALILNIVRSIIKKHFSWDTIFDLFKWLL